MKKIRNIQGLVVGLVSVAVLSITTGILLGLLVPRTTEFRADFMRKCVKFMGEEYK